MAEFTVWIRETRLLAFSVSADTFSEAEDIAMDMDTSDATTDSYEERIVDEVVLED